MTKAFRRLAETYRDKVYTFAYYCLRRREDAEDVTQETMVKLWQHQEKVDPQKMTSWVMRVARNAVIDAARRNQVRSSVIAEGVEIDVAEVQCGANPNPAAVSSNPEAAVESREFRETLEAALATLEEPYRSIVVMREIQEMTYAEIVDTVQMPLNTVKVYLFRGRRKLRDALRGKS